MIDLAAVPDATDPRDAEASRDPAITDTRIVEFGPEAIRVAVETVGVVVLRLKWGIRVANIALHPDSNSLHIEFSDSTAARIAAEGELAAVLIAYCMATKIPIPSKAAKTLHVTPHSVSLRFVITVAKPPRPERLAQRGRVPA